MGMMRLSSPFLSNSQYLRTHPPLLLLSSSFSFNESLLINESLACASAEECGSTLTIDKAVVGSWLYTGVDRVTRMKKHRNTYQNIATHNTNIRKTKGILIILVFFGTMMKHDYQDDSFFSSWYPIKTGYSFAIINVPIITFALLTFVVV